MTPTTTTTPAVVCRRCNAWPCTCPDGITVICGDTRRVLADLTPGQFDLIATDPPYSSGGQFRGDRAQPTSAKYNRAEYEYRPDFAGDSRDQRTYLLWSELWLGDCLRLAAPGCALAVFTDWRQLSTVTDAIQVAGWVFRGLAIWDKVQTRPQKGWFRQDSEFIVLGSAGPLDRSTKEGAKVSPGIFRHFPNPNKRRHPTEKPVPLMADIIGTSPNFQNILDPFAGAGSTGRAAKDLGRKATLVEISPEFADLAADGLRQDVLLPTPTPTTGEKDAPRLF